MTSIDSTKGDNMKKKTGPSVEGMIAFIAICLILMLMGWIEALP